MSTHFVRRSAFSLLTVFLVACGSEKPAMSRGVALQAVDTCIDGPGDVIVCIPAGAVSEDTTITITSAPSARRPSAAVVVSTLIRMSPEGQVFTRPVSLEIPISPNALPSGKTIDDVVVMRAPRGTDIYVPLPTRRTSAATVVALTEHFSDFVAVVWVGDAGAPTGCLDGTCGTDESCDTCPADCGLCVAADVCGNASCELQETCVACPFDCPCLPGNGCVGDFVDAIGACGTRSVCAAGTYVAAPWSSTSDAVCTPCTAGSYSDQPHAAGCTLCPIGSVSTADGATSCTVCASGLEATTSGLSACVDVDECLVNNGGCTGTTPICSNNVGAPPTCLGIPMTGLSLWLDPARSVYSDNGTTPAIDGGPVQSWTDVGGLARTCTQGTVAQRPTFRASVPEFNGLPGLAFDIPAATMLDCDPVTARTVFAVARYSSAAFGWFPGIFGNKNNGSVGILYGQQSGTAFQSDVAQLSLDGTPAGSMVTPNTTITSPHLITAMLASTVTATNRVGQADTAGNTWSGEIAEILVYDTALNAASVRLVECYLGMKYAIPIGHTCP